MGRTEKMANMIFLGTGDAMTMRRYHTCWLLEQEETLLVDGGGGQEILRRMAALHYDWNRVRAMFLTHGHTDHLLGAIWVIRQVVILMGKGRYTGEFTVYTHEALCRLVDTICATALSGRMQPLYRTRVKLVPLADGETVETCGLTLTAFDLHSTKLTQFGFRAALADGTTVVTLGDEPFHEVCRPYAAGADWLLSEAFCLYRDRETAKPYEKCHATALDAGRNAAGLGVKHLVLYHTEDYGEERRALFTAEAREVFSGAVFVPEDMETVSLSETE